MAHLKQRSADGRSGQPRRSHSIAWQTWYVGANVNQDRSDERAAQAPGSGSEPEQPDVAARIRKASVKAALFKKPTQMRVGRFILLERIGAGAMGEVYAAYDEQLDRKVALKLVRSAVKDSTRAHERLLREAQTLAQLSHPNVVQVYEAGTHEGNVFIAMEFIRGQTLTAWLETTAELPRAQRQREILRQFVAAGRGLEASHRAGLAHRDFKPDNVLVGDDGRVRVVDFGLARAVAEVTPTPDAPGREARAGTQPRAGRDDIPVVTGELTLDMGAPAPVSSGSSPMGQEPTEALQAPGPVDVTLDDVSTSSSGQRKAALRLTATGMVMGTPRYMAPEQMRGQTADHRSDQFSFCVSLFHALYGEWPFRGGNPLALMQAAARGEIVLPRHLAEVPAPVRKAILRGLSGDPAGRFPDMGELLRVIESAAQRRRRTIQGLTATALVAGTVAAFAAVAQRPEPCAGVTREIDALWSPARRSALAAAFHTSGIPYAAAAWRSAESLVDQYVTSWRSGARDACEATYVDQRQSAELLDRRNLCLDRGKQRLDALLASIGGTAPLSQEVVEHVSEVAAALPDVGVCSDTRSLLLGVEPPAQPALAQAVKEVRERLAEARTHALFGRKGDALQVAEVQHRTALALPYPPLQAEALFHVGLALAARGTSDDATQAEAMYLEAVDLAEGARHDQLAAEIWHVLVILAGDYHSSTERGYAWSRREQAAVRRLGDPPLARAQALHALGTLYARDADHAAAVEQYRQAITLLQQTPRTSALLASYYHDWANSESTRGDYTAARPLFERALALAVAQYGAVHPKVARVQNDFARMLLELEEFDRARALLEAAVDTSKQVYGSEHYLVGKFLFTLTRLEARAGNLEQARAHAREGQRIYEHVLAPDHRYHAEAYTCFGVIDLRQGDFQAARAAFETALRIRRRHLDAGHLMIGWTEYYLAESLLGLGRYEDALAQSDAAQGNGGSSRPADLRALLLSVRGRALLGQGQIAPAIEVLERAVDELDDLHGLSWERAAALWALARALRAGGTDAGARAESLAREAQAIYAARGRADAGVRDAIAAWLDEQGER
jgi:serine/threonine protein kinase/tetratricopeptide (TPR) repeat protein